VSHATWAGHGHAAAIDTSHDDDPGETFAVEAEAMDARMDTECETCGAPIAWCELTPDGFGCSGDCPVCGALVIRPRAQPFVQRPSAVRADAASLRRRAS
jgi:hypothetical protein